MWKFILAYLLIYGSVHIVFFRRISVLLPDKSWVNVLVSFVLVLMTLSPLMTRILEVKAFDSYARYAAYATYLWMGFIFLAFCGILLMYCYNIVSWGFLEYLYNPLLTGLSRGVDIKFNTEILKPTIPTQ